MRRFLLGLSVVAVLGLSTIALAAGASQAKSWIDDPLDGLVLPLAPMKVVAHATDPDGITQVRLDVNGATVVEMAPENAGSALVLVEVVWDPPAAGVYLLEVVGGDGSGTWGQPGSVVITILADDVLDSTTTTSSPTTTRTSPTTTRPTTTIQPTTTSTSTSTTTTLATTTTTLVDTTTTTLVDTTTTTERPTTTTTLVDTTTTTLRRP